MSCFFSQEEKEFFEDVTEEELEPGCWREGFSLLGGIDTVPKFTPTLRPQIR
jgi:hypothetical protein